MRRAVTKAIGLGFLAATTLQADRAPMAEGPAPAYAACKNLGVVVLDFESRTVRATPSFVLTNGAEYMGTTYIFDPNKASVTVEPADDPGGTVEHTYPQSPGGPQEHEIRAIINYRKPGEMAVFGAIDMCAVNILL